MSLQVWLPLDGTLANYGLNSIKAQMSSNPLSIEAGKVTNKSYKWDEGMNHDKRQYIFLPNFMNTLKTYSQYTFSAWVYFTGPANNHSSTICSSGDWNQPTGQLCFALYSDNYENGYKKLLIPNQSYWSSGFSLSEKLLPYTWYHIAVTYDGETTIGYINGKCVGHQKVGGIAQTSNSPDLYIGGATYYEGFTIRGKINDFRIYNNCLSSREIKQLARGLSLHYKLDSIIKNPNLITSMNSGYRTAVFGEYGLNGDFSYPGADTYGYFNVSPSLEPNKQYTLSFDVFDFPSQSIWGWSLWNDSNYSFLVKKNGHYKYTFFAPEQTSYNLSRFLFDDKGRTNPQGIVKFRNFKIEEGSRDTGWCPYENNSISSDSIEIDCSGYFNNGTRVGTHISGDDSLRYKKSRVFNNNQYISKSRISNSNSTTISVWLKINSYPTDNIVVFADDTSKVAFGFYNNGSAIVSCGSGNNATPIILNLKEKWTVQDWHMVTVVKNNNEYKFYLDGQPWSLYGSFNYWTTSIQNLLTIGCRNNGNYANFFSGQMSDFRIYETALSDKDIIELYNVAISCTKENSLLTYEINETEPVDNIKYGKNDIKANGFTEIGYIDGMKIKVLPDKSAWARIHWLDVTGRESEKETTGRNPYFNSNEEVAFCDEVNRFSKMGLVDHFRNNDGVYEFMLTHPKISEVDYNRWTQTSSPNETTVIGFTNITAAWSQAHGGIRKHGTAAVYDCDTGDTWYAPIGQKTQWTTGKYIPAANETSTTEIELWVRIDNLPKINKISMFNNNTVQALQIKEL